MPLSQCPRCKTRLRGEIARCPFDGEALSVVDDPLLGRTIAGRYLIEEQLGSGGMGTVYRGRHQVIDRAVALKFLHSRYGRDETQRKRFLGEARAANQINHENIIDVTDFGETEDGHVYLVMEYLEGRCLADAIDEKPMKPGRAVAIARQIALGLSRAHELDVIHRDVKPDNIFLLHRSRNPDFVKLLDFGIAHFERELRITDKGMLVGTPEYMAPEQLRGGVLGPATDLYALGCVLFEMLTGVPPFVGAASSVMIKQVTHPPPVPSTINDRLPEALDALVLKLLRKSPAERHRDAFHLIEELDGLELDRPKPGALDHARPGPSSSPAHAREPASHAPTEEQDWRRRVSMYRQLLATAYPDGRCPEDLTACVTRMEATLEEAAQMRTQLDQLALTASSQANATRGMRDTIMHALDELARDESAVARGLDALDDELARRERELDEASARIATLARGAPPLPASGGRMGQEAHRHLTGLVEAAQTLAELRAQTATLRAQKRDRQHQRDDLQFQMAQLKGRLATRNAESQVVMNASGGRANELEDRIREHLDRLVPDATTLADRLRDHPAFRRVFG